MTNQATGKFEIKNWDEKAYDETTPKLVRATVIESYSGDIEGEASIEYLMAYLPGGSARYTGQTCIRGRIGDRAGAFVLQDTGVYEGGHTAKGALSILAGFGTGDLVGIRGEGAYVSTMGEKPVECAGRTWQPTGDRSGNFILDYDFD